MCDTVTGDTVECHTETADNGVTLRQPYQWLITKTKLVSPHQPQVTVTRSRVLGSSSKDNDKYAWCCWWNMLTAGLQYWHMKEAGAGSSDCSAQCMGRRLISCWGGGISHVHGGADIYNAQQLSHLSILQWWWWTGGDGRRWAQGHLHHQPPSGSCQATSYRASTPSSVGSKHCLVFRSFNMYIIYLKVYNLLNM